MLIDDWRCLLAADRVLLLAGDGFCAAACHDLGAGKARLLEQRLKPRLELVIDVVHENDARLGHDPAVGKRRLIEFGISVRADDGDEINMIASNVCDHVAKHAERRDHRWPFGAVERGCLQQSDGDACAIRNYGGADPINHRTAFKRLPIELCPAVPIIERP